MIIKSFKFQKAASSFSRKIIGNSLLQSKIFKTVLGSVSVFFRYLSLNTYEKGIKFVFFLKMGWFCVRTAHIFSSKRCLRGGNKPDYSVGADLRVCPIRLPHVSVCKAQRADPY